jgi:hypothetical protein
MLRRKSVIQQGGLPRRDTVIQVEREPEQTVAIRDFSRLVDSPVTFGCPAATVFATVDQVKTDSPDFERLTEMSNSF